MAHRSRWFWPALLGMCGACLVTRVLILREAWESNPLARVPDEDAAVYWGWAAELAAGRLVGSTPFFSAPLYPYVLGLLRALGGGLPTVYAVQTLLHAATVVLIGLIGARRFGPATGVVAAGLFALLGEPAFFVGRVLNGTLQLFLVCALWVAMLSAWQRRGTWTWLPVGVLFGLNCLANPPLIAAIIVLVPWAFTSATRPAARVGSAAAFLLLALLAIAPAAVHNYLACGEMIPISAQAGITFQHGNGPGADGTYNAIPGVPTQRVAQNLAARRMCARQTGDESWSGTSRFFFHGGLAFWAEDPGRAARLAARKVYWFLTGRNYGDIYMPTAEARLGLGRRMILAPLPVAWLTLPAVLGLVVLLRRPWRHVPELVLFGVPFLVVVAFWYSPRYRLPALPIIVVLAAWMICRATKWRRAPLWTLATGVVLLASIGLGLVNRAVGFDLLERFLPRIEQRVGRALAESGDLATAAEHYRAALRLDPRSAQAASGLGDILQRLGQTDEAMGYLEQAVVADPDDPQLRTNLGVALARQGRLDAAIDHLARVVQANPDQWQFHNNLANALASAGRDAEAIEQYEAALRSNPAYPAAHFNLARAQARQGRWREALAHYREAVRFDPELAAAHYEMSLLLAGLGQHDESIASARRAHRLAPPRVDYTNALAWQLATAPDRPADERREAVRLARQAVARGGARDASLLDTLAAALAADGHFDEAAETAAGALGLAEEHRSQPLADALRERLRLYRMRRPYVAVPAPRHQSP